MGGLTNPERDREELMLLIRGFQVSRLLRLVADLCIADRIPPDGALGVDELAAACIVRQGPLLRVLRALAAFEVFHFIGDGRVAHTSRSLLLRSGEPNGLHYAARFYTAPGSWKAWCMLDEALTGQIPHQAAWGISRFDYLRGHPDEARVFDAFMAHSGDGRHDAIAAAYDFSGASLIADIGGGNGETLRLILSRFPAAKGVIFDRDDVVTAIPSTALLGGRLKVVGGSFFEHVPSGADVYLLVRVLHDWSDDDCVRILSACRMAMENHARLIIGEQILDPDPSSGAPVGYLTDIQMMAMFGGAKERTEAEYGKLLGDAGFTFLRLIPTASIVSIIEAAAK